MEKVAKVTDPVGVLKLSEMTAEQLVYFFELWARGRKNVSELKDELLRRLQWKEQFKEGQPERLTR